MVYPKDSPPDSPVANQKVLLNVSISNNDLQKIKDYCWANRIENRSEFIRNCVLSYIEDMQAGDE